MSRMMIERRAYEIWEAEGRPAGRADAHWEAAERELTAAQPASATPTESALERRTAVLGKPAAKARAPKTAVSADKPAKAVTAKPSGRRKREEP